MARSAALERREDCLAPCEICHRAGHKETRFSRNSTEKTPTYPGPGGRMMEPVIRPYELKADGAKVFLAGEEKGKSAWEKMAQSGGERDRMGVGEGTDRKGESGSARGCV
jgi:hypothetical protein